MNLNIKEEVQYSTVGITVQNANRGMQNPE